MLGVLLVCTAALCAISDDAQLIEDLKANWESQRSAIATARFRARAFRHTMLKPLTPQDVAAVFASVDLAGQPDDLRKVVTAICTLKEFSTPDPWSIIEVTLDGARLRERRLNSPGGIDDNVVDQGITVIGMGPAKQTSILRTSDSTWRHRNLADFRFIPFASDKCRVVSRESGRVRIVDQGESREEMDVDGATGFVHSYRLYLKGDVLANEVLQFGPVNYPGDVILPTAIAKLSYSNGTLQHANVLVIERAEVNIDLPRDAFVATARKGTLIADYRDPQRKDVFYARSDIDDVAKAFPLSGSQSSEISERSTSSLQFLAAGVAVAIVGLLVFLSRRARSLACATLCFVALDARMVGAQEKAPDGSNEAELVENLKANWESQRGAIATAYFRARLFHSGEMQPLTHERVAAVLDSVDLVKRADDLGKIVAATCKHKKFSTADPWGIVELVLDGSRSREKTALAPTGISDNLVDAGLVVLGRTDIGQVGIIRRAENRWRLRDLDDFRLVPVPEDGGELKIVRQDLRSGRITLADSSEPTFEIEVEASSGFVYSLRRYSDSSTVTDEVLQFGPTLFPGDVVLPAASARFGYTNGVLSTADIVVVEECRVNVDLPRDAFVMKAPKGTLIADSRDRRRSRRFRAAADIADVVAAFPLEGGRRLNAAPGSSWWMPLAGGGVFLAFFAILLFYGRQRNRQ